MLYPQQNTARLRLELGGLWQFQLSYDNAGADLDPAAPLPAPRPMAVPASYNDQGEDKALRDHYGWAFYQRTVALPALFAGQRLVLRFGAVTHRARVWLDGALIAEHKGGFLPFEADVTGKLVPGIPALLTVACDNRVDHSTLPVGNEPGQIAFFGSDNAGIPSVEHAKATAAPQNRPNFDFFNFAGIHRPVWLYTTPADHIRDITLVPRQDGTVDYRVDTAGQGTVTVEVLDPEGRTVARAGGARGTVRVPSPRLWEPWPGNPWLYTARVRFGQDCYDQTFGFREIRVEGTRLLLNGRPYFQNGVLDQGYFPDGLYTAPSDDALVYDIQLAKDMGFNMLRKHIKVECDRWYYHCDRLGMLVWQDMPCGGRRYDPLIVSTPLVTGWHLDDSWYPLFGRTNVTARKAFLNELRDMVTTLYNHPCIAVWVPFNEGWGQFDSQTAVQVIQSVDKTRTIDPASGWHDQGFGDVRSLHVYFQKYRFQPDKLGRATLLSEFGGYIHRVEGHAVGGKSVGYKTCDAPLSLEYALQALYDEQIRPAIAQGLSAAVYTQLSDVEHELNGLVTYDRSVVKLPVQTLHKIFYIENE